MSMMRNNEEEHEYCDVCGKPYPKGRLIKVKTRDDIEADVCLICRLAYSDMFSHELINEKWSENTTKQRNDLKEAVFYHD